MNMKKGVLIFSAFLLVISIILFWFSGFWIGLGMTFVLGAFVALSVSLVQRNPRWWLVLLVLVVSITFVRCGFTNLMQNEPVQTIEEVVIDTESESEVEVEDTDTDADEETVEEVEPTEEVGAETDEAVDNLEEDCADKEIQEPEQNPEPVVIEKVVEKKVEVPVVVEKKVEVPVEKEVIKYVEVPAKSETTQTTKSAATQSMTTQPTTITTTPNYNYNNYGYYGDPTSSGYGYGSNYGYSSDPTMNNSYGYGYGSGSGYYGDPTSNGYNNNSYYSSSITITGNTSVVAGNSYTYTITGVSSITKSKLDLPANVSIEKVSGNRVTLYFEEGWSGTYSIGYGSAELKIKVRAN